MAFISENWSKYLTTIVLVPEIPLFPKHFSLRSTSSPYLNCIAMNQSQDTEWGVKYLCYRTSMKKLHLSWSSNGPIGGQDCINTAMPYERTAKLWNNSFLCLPRDSLLKLRWSVSGELKGWGCLFMRNGQHARTRYLLCGKTKYEKSGKLDFLQPDLSYFFWDTKSFWTIISDLGDTDMIIIIITIINFIMIINNRSWILGIFIQKDWIQSIFNYPGQCMWLTEKQNTQPFTDHSYFTTASGIYYLNESSRGFKGKTFGYKIWLNVWSLNKKMFL